MANTRSAAKRARQMPARALRNRSVLSRLGSLQKRAATKANNEDVRALISALDKAAKRGIIHKNAANRRKARLNKLLSAKPGTPTA
ncbi:MAG: 30S ribosomal protein S20 [Verrucomicrobiota bacterium]